MKRILLSVIFLFGSIIGVFAAEHILLGRVVDTTSGSGVGYATVVLTDAKGNGVSAVAADKEGAFTLFYNQGGDYKLVISSVGYSTAEQNISLDKDNSKIDLGNIAIQAGVEIESVDIKPLVIEKDDRLVYNVKADPEAKYRKMSAIMAKVPGLTNMGYRGRLSHKDGKIDQILIDGKPISLISEARQYTMEFIGAAVMDEIEVIMPYSAEYGNTGIIINIKTNQPLPLGFASEVGGDAAIKEGRYKADVDMAAKVGETLSFGASYAYSLTHSPTLHQNSLSEYLGPEGGAPLYVQHNNAADSTRGQTHQFGIDYITDVGKEGGLSTAIRGSISDQNRYSFSESWRTVPTTGDISNKQSSNSSNNTSSPLNIFCKLNFNHPIIKGKSGFWFWVQYNHNESTTDSWVDTNHSNGSAFATHNSSYTRQDRFSTRASGTFSFSDNPREPYPAMAVDLEYSSRSYDNSSLYETSQDGGDFIVNPNEGLVYNQNILSASVRGMFKPKKYAISLHFSLLYDHTTGLYRNTGNTPLNYSMWTWRGSGSFTINKLPLPLGVNMNVNPMQPSFSLLNPYVDDSNPMHLRYGNPNLRPEMNYSIDLSPKHTRATRKLLPKWMYIEWPSYRFTYVDNSINPITQMREDGVTVSTYDNFGNEQKHEVRCRMSINPFKRVGIGLNGTFTSSTYNITEDYSNTINTFTWSASTSYNLRKNKWFDNTAISASYSARPTATMAQAVKYGYYHSLGLSFSTQIPKIKAGFSVNVGDVLHGHKFVESTIRSGTFIRHSSNEVLGRSINISAYIRFGKFRKAAGEMDAPDDSLKSF